MNLADELGRRLRVARESLSLAVVGDGPEALLTAWRAVRAAGPAAATTDVAGLAALPPGSTVLHVLSPDHALTLNLFRNALRVRVVWFVARDDLALVRDRAPDLWDWIAHVWFLDVAPWTGAHAGLREAALRGEAVVHGGDDGQVALGWGPPRRLDAAWGWERLVEGLRGARVRRWVTGDAWGVARARWAEALHGEGGSCVVDAAFDGWPAREVASGPMSLAAAAALGRPLHELLDLELDPVRVTPPPSPQPGTGPAARAALHLRSGGREGWRALELVRGLGHADVARALARRLSGDPDPAVRWAARDALGEPTGAEAHADALPEARLRVGRRRARSRLREGDPDGALALVDALLPVARGLPDPREVALVRGLVAEVHSVRGELALALAIHEGEELPVYEATGDVRAAAYVWGRVADVLTARGEVDRALELRLRREIPVHARTGDERARAVALGKVANVLQWRGQLDEALRLRREGLLVFERCGDARERAVTQGKIADILLARGEVDEALRLWRDEVAPAFERVGAPRERAMAVGKVASVLAMRGDVEGALRLHLDEELPVYERLGAARERAITWGRVAELYAATGRGDDARRLIGAEELPVYERLHMPRERAAALGRLADLAHRAGDLDEALRVRLEQELPVYEELGDVRAAAVTRFKVGDVRAERREWEAALADYAAALGVLEQLGDVRAVAGVLGRIAHVRARMGAADEALRIRLQRQLPVLERLGDVREQLVAHTRVAELLEERGDAAGAAEHRAWAARTSRRTGIVP